MKKLLTLISAVGMGATGLTGALNVVSCSKKDDKKDHTKLDLELRKGAVINVTVSGESAQLFADNADDKGNISTTITVAANTPAKLTKLNDDNTKKALKDVLKGDAIKSFVEGIKTSQIKDLVVAAIKTDATLSAVKDTDVTAFADLGTVISNQDKNFDKIEVKDGVYGLETVDWNTGLDKDETDRSKDINDIKQELLNRLNENIKKGSKALTLTNTNITFKEPATGKFVPSSATIEIKDEKATDISGIGGSVDVTFIIEQNIDPNGFILADKDGKETHYPGVNIVNQKPGSATIEIQKGAGDNDKIYLADIHIPDFSAWKYGDDYSDQFYNEKKPEDTSLNDSHIFVGTGDGDKFIKISTTTANVGATNKITFHVHSGGFKNFVLTISMITKK